MAIYLGKIHENNRVLAEKIHTRLEALPRYKVSELDDMLLPDPVPDGNWVMWSDILKVLEESHEGQ